VPKVKRGATIATFGGANGSGKTAISKLVGAVLTNSLVLDTSLDNYGPSVLRVAEPPAMPLTRGGQDTWRSILKSHKSLDQAFPVNILNDPLNQAAGFLLARRIAVEQPLIFGQWNDIVARWGGPVAPFNLFRKATPFNGDRGSVITVRDRSTETTFPFQGFDNSFRERPEVLSLIREMYQRHQLIQDDVTIIIDPAGEMTKKGGGREEAEPDAYNELNDVARYRRLVRRGEGIFTRKVIFLENDPTGTKNFLSKPVIVASMLSELAFKLKEGMISGHPKGSSIKCGESYSLESYVMNGVTLLEETEDGLVGHRTFLMTDATTCGDVDVTCIQEPVCSRFWSRPGDPGKWSITVQNKRGVE
jgi:hypothetical protein